MVFGRNREVIIYKFSILLGSSFSISVARVSSPLCHFRFVGFFSIASGIHVMKRKPET